MLNSSARLIYDLRRSDHVTDALASLHWLRVLLTFHALLGEVSQYLSEKLLHVADVSSRRWLRSSTSQLMVPRYRLSTMGSRSFSVAGTTIWNQLTTDVTFSSSLPEFKRKLRTHLFRFVIVIKSPV